MIERVVARKRRIGFVKLSLVSAAVSLGVAVALTGVGQEGGSESVFVSALLGLAQGFLIPMAVLLVSDALHAHPGFKRLPYLLQLVIQVLLLAGMTVAISTAGAFAIARDLALAMGGMGPALVIGFGIAFLMILYSTLREFLGRRFLRDLALGLYGRAREERAIVAFVDIRGSTGIAEALPPIRFFDLLNDFFALVGAYVTYHGGTIYKYVGDGAVLVWRETPRNAASAMDLVTGLIRDLGVRADRFRRAYGMPLECTAGVHAGKVLVGGIGQEKRELGYWGDTLNTASRIQGMCSHYGEPALFSSEFVEALGPSGPPPAVVAARLRCIPGVELRGKQGVHTLYAVEASAVSPPD